jgi:hypothetical protein
MRIAGVIPRDRRVSASQRTTGVLPVPPVVMLPIFYWKQLGFPGASHGTSISDLPIAETNAEFFLHQYGFFGISFSETGYQEKFRFDRSNKTFH